MKQIYYLFFFFLGKPSLYQVKKHSLSLQKGGVKQIYIFVLLMMIKLATYVAAGEGERENVGVGSGG